MRCLVILKLKIPQAITVTQYQRTCILRILSLRITIFILGMYCLLEQVLDDHMRYHR